MAIFNKAPHKFVVFLSVLVMQIAGLAVAKDEKPSVLIIHGKGACPEIVGDFDYYRRLNQHGFQIDTHFFGETPERPLNWELIQNYNCLIFLDLPLDEKSEGDLRLLWKKCPPYREEMKSLIESYLQEGGGVFIMPDLESYWNTVRQMENLEFYLRRWGAHIPLEMIQDPSTETIHPRDTMPFIYTEEIKPSPVSKGVKGIWFPTKKSTAGTGHIMFPGWPIEVSGDWTEVARGSNKSSTKKIDPGMFYLPNMYYRSNQSLPPTLFAIREFPPEGRMALTVLWPVFTLHGGLSWIHNGAVIDKGLKDKPSDFGKLFENTLRWLSEPSIQSGKLGGYVQDPKKLVHPHFRKKPEEQFPPDVCVQPQEVNNVFRGLIGARTGYSSGKGTVQEYASSAKEAGLDFIIFLEDFSKLTQENFQKLEDDCRKFSADNLLLVPGYTIQNNIGNYLFFYGYGTGWPTKIQLAGQDNDRLKLQNFDDKGQLYYSDEGKGGAKNLLWHQGSGTDRNIGYYNFANSGNGVPVRDLRIFGMLAVVTYIDGKFTEDITPDYLNYTRDGNPPLACAVDIVCSPDELVQAVKNKHYLTYVAANNIQGIPSAMHYGHQYGRANVYPSQGPEIKSWAETQRVMTFSGEPFVPARYRIRPLLWVKSDVGLKEIIIYSDNKPYRRFLLDGKKEFKEIFEWSYDRQRILVAEITDMENRRAVSAGLEIWCDANSHQWCSDRQNGTMWHGPLTFGLYPRGGSLDGYESTGPTWDGGPLPGNALELEFHPGLRRGNICLEGRSVGYGGRLMEGDTWLSCWDDSVCRTGAIGTHNYAPGEVANAYHTLGPIFPSQYMTFTLYYTMYIARIVGPRIDWHPMWAERTGGTLSLCEGSITIRKESKSEFSEIDILSMNLNPAFKDINFPASVIRQGEAPRGNPPAMLSAPDGLQAGPRGVSGAAQRNSAVTNNPASSRSSRGRPAIHPRDKPQSIPAKANNDKDPVIFESGKSMKVENFQLNPGGYAGLLANEQFNNKTTIIFNLGKEPVYGTSGNRWNFWLSVPEERAKPGETFSWKYLILQDSIKQPADPVRIERIYQYLGLDKKHNSGIVVKQGRIMSHFGIIDLEPKDGRVEFEINNPGFEFRLPLGLRFMGFNPNWTVGELQITGYSPGYYTDGSNVYRNLGPDDKGIVYLSIYPDLAPKTHCIIGHPVQCDNPDLIIEFTQLNRGKYHIAVNNPTDKPIETALKKSMDLPGFEFANTNITVAAGGYIIVKE